MYSRTSPKRLTGLVIGLYYLHLFVGNNVVGWLAGFMETMRGAEFWAMHAMLVAAAGVLFLAVKLLFGRVLSPERDPRAVIGEPIGAV